MSIKQPEYEMINSPYELGQDDHNPLDLVEDLASHKNWYYERVNGTTLTLQMAGQRSKFDLQLEWQDEFCALQFCCFMGMKISDTVHSFASDFLMQTNEDLWLGHFVLDKQTSQPVFRYTMMLEHIPSAVSVEMIADLIELAICESDRFYTTFKMLSEGSIQTHEVLSAAMMETIGEA
jgi:hypothetical protein